MKIRTDKILTELLETNEKWCRLRRNGRFATRDLVLVDFLSELESRGDAMRYLDNKGRVAWKATPRLQDHVDDLRQDAEADLESEVG
jgi:hypothetical protein